jgi:hypothetical protein
MRLALRNLFFTVVVPGAGAVYAPWWILTRGGATPAGRLAGRRLHRRWCRPLPRVRLGVRARRAWHTRAVGSPAAPRSSGAVPVGPQSHLPRRAPGDGWRGVAVPLPPIGPLRGRGRGRRPSVRGRVRRAHPAPPVRRRVRGVSTHRLALDPAAASTTRRLARRAPDEPPTSACGRDRGGTCRARDEITGGTTTMNARGVG